MFPLDNKLNEKDYSILRLMQEDCRISLSKIGETLGLSHVTVGRRLERLIKEEYVKPLLAVNPNKFSFYFSITLMEVEKGDDMDEIIEQFQDCPRILSIMSATGSYNVILISITENQQVLESMMSYCSPRTQANVRRSEILLCMPLTKFFLFIPIPTVSEGDICSCGLNCRECTAYTNEKCPGCPSKSYYRKTKT